MVTRLYPTGQFAEKAGVTIRTLRFYDKVGLLRPTAVTHSGHRRYSDQDLIRLEQILALKFLGFSLEEIREIGGTDDLQLQDSIALQRQMLEERRSQIDQAVEALGHLESALAAGWRMDWELLNRVIRVIQMTQSNDQWKKYYSDAARKKIEERQKGYTQEQAWADAKRWEEVIAGMKAAFAAGADPASPEVQDLARRSLDLIAEFTMGDPEIEKGLASSYQAKDSPWPKPYSDQEAEFVDRAMEICRNSK